MTGAIARRWEGVVKRADLKDWVGTFRERVLPGMRAIDGWRGVSFLCEQTGDPCRVSVTTMWKDEAALRNFSGDNLTRAVVPDFMARFFVEYDADATLHTELFLETGR